VIGPPVYLDYNATAPVRPEAAAAVAGALALTGNPSSVHRFGRQVRKLVEDAREQVAALIGAAPAEIVFTGGGTEANALALCGTGRKRMLVSAIEHDSVLALDPAAPRIPATRSGLVDLDALDRLLASQGGETIVSVMLANNETGVIQPAAEIARRAHAAGALFHCDAVQAAGKIAIDVRAVGADLLSLSAHKLGGPQGAGALYVADRVALQPALRGGGQERGRRAGTENVPGIAGFGAAAAAARRDVAGGARIAALRDALEAAVLARSNRTRRIGVRIAGAESPRLPNTSCIVLPGVASETQVMALDLAGVAVSAGSACSSGKVKASHVLAAMGLSADEAGAAIRVSLGWASAPADVDRFVEAWSAMAARRAAA
jgi:cysteine desulfurase